ncbi:SusC/RagA family TonB-linked outer membrane protein [Pedobacter gandavensis]|uniref:SusC/RagA family TonB-linked outer membrane protein n=1 Tax=Pedobacter gandavensis TaxID=2679963 RepID=A0ABR6ER58_9SPHI|nr:SusC/RagA family TonB-linked outer membrane protein [Pedobacter gandavensis]MBB2147344.1 SusC/RagA family TonB-linked outer membrane protein [Pedobacter gandavensis]
MKKTIYLLVMAVLCLNVKVPAQQLTELKGQVTSTSDKPLAGATIKIKSETTVSTTDPNGVFTIKTSVKAGTLIVSFLGYQTKELQFDIKKAKYINIILQESANALTEVSIVSTGYQNISRDRVTGSFVVIDSILLNRKISPNILERLDGIASGLLFNRNKTQGGQSDINIRGRSTINGEDKPLIILDNFPYEGDLSNINPNDVKTIDILKDAAAASIWGTRAGNGVIVITTYKGKYATKQQISFNTNITVGDKPNLHQMPWFSASEWIEQEKFIYDKGGYNTTINNGYSAISAAVEIFNHAKNKKMSSADSLKLINQLKQNDVRDEMLKYLYRPSLNQQYALNLKGGGIKNKYFVSIGYDKNLMTKITDSYNRLTLSANRSYLLLKDKLEISTGLSFTSSTSETGDTYIPTSPYDRLADDQGNSLAVKNFFRLSYVDTVGKGKLLDWHYRPLNENQSKSQYKTTNYTFNAGLNYTIFNGFKATFLYQHQKQNGVSKINYDADSYYTRDYINRLSTINKNTGTVQQVVPYGDIFTNNGAQYAANYGRFQLNFDKIFSGNHRITSIGGLEVRDGRTDNLAQKFYGYNPSTGTHANTSINFTNDYPLFYDPTSTLRIDLGQTSSYLQDRFISYYANANYSFKDRYVLTVSARKDESNIFGVKPNQKGVPLWSTGLAWEISKEKFYNLSWIPFLKIRGSFGYSGNVSKSISAYLTASAIGSNTYGSQFSLIVNPPNPSLKWEKVKVINLGLDFAFKNNIISGTLEPYLKYGLDLFGTTNLAPQTGLLTYQGNFANTKTKGLDLTINTININRTLKWNTTLLFSMVKDKVTRYTASRNPNSNLISQSYNNPVEGNPYFSIYGYKWAGLNSDGDPLAYLDNNPSKAYSSISNSLDRSNLKLIGSAVPTTFGSIRNTFNYKQLDLSFNITYRLNYFIRRISLNNASIFGANGFQSNIDYNLRWQKAGDEAFTNVPALVYPNISQRSAIYTNSDILVVRGDNIRFQDLNIGYNLKQLMPLAKYFSNLKVYTYITEFGYLWKANNYGIDPDNSGTSLGSLSNPMTFSFGISATF